MSEWRKNVRTKSIFHAGLILACNLVKKLIYLSPQNAQQLLILGEETYEKCWLLKYRGKRQYGF